MIEKLFDLKGKTALVTGGAKGIGAMISQGLIEAGVKVYISSRSAETCEAFAKEMNKIGECIPLPADLSKMENIDSLVEAINEKEDKLDILVNNSGVAWGAPLEEFPEQGWDKVMDLNVKTVFFLSQKLLPLLKAAGTPDQPARIINISSVAAEAPFAMFAFSYGPSKAAVKQMTRNLANALAKENILVNAIAPGYFSTNMNRHMGEEQMIKVTPIGRIGKATDIAGLTIYLCSNAGSFMTGNYIPLDGGILIG